MKNSTSFKKGQGGRPAGTPNKTTTDVKEFISNFINDNKDQLQQDFDSLEPMQRLAMFEKFLKYVLPTMKESSIIEKPQINEYENWTEEELEAEIKRLRGED